MDEEEAAALLRGAVPEPGGVWADIGAGEGTFTRALFTRIGTTGRIYAVDRDARALARLARWAMAERADVTTVVADFTGDFELPGLDEPGLDGLLLANALHFVRDAAAVLGCLAERVRPGGRIILIEYDGRRPNPWIPFPIPSTRVAALATSAGLSMPVVTATRRSRFGGTLYVAACDRLAPPRREATRGGSA